MTDTFRLVPPAVRTAWIERPRLTRLLERRFAVDIVVMVAPAGYGKTTSLTLALDRNADQALGVDLWLQCDSRDADPDVLAAGLLTAAGLPPTGTGFTGSAEKVADALLRFAPRPVCLVIDDLHFLAPDCGSIRLLDELIDLLPTHAHLVLSSRVAPPLRLARRRAQGRVEEIGIEDLAFDDDEVDRVHPGHEGVDAEVARWPAMVSLLARGSSADTVDFLLEEVAESLGPDRLAALAALSHLRTVDEDIARAATEGEYGGDQLLGRLPLVQRTPDGAFQMHDLWRDALAQDGLDPEAADALRRVARHLLEDWHFIEATRQFAAAGDTDGVEDAARAFVSQPLMFMSAADLRQMADLTARLLPDRPIAAVLNATVALVGDERASAEAFEAAAEVAREAGDARVEVVALQNAANMRGVFEPFDVPDWLVERAEALAAAGEPLGVSLEALLSSHRARAVGRPEEAAEHLGRLSPTVSLMDRVQHAFGMSDLGRPEEVATPTEPELATLAAAQAGGQYLAQAIWLRGEIAPEPALELGRGLADATDAREVPHVQISTNGVLAFVAVAAGAQADARRFTDRAARWVGHTVSEHVRTFATLADAATVAGDGDEEEAATRIRRMLETVPIDPWPYRAYFYALPLLYVLAPDTRPALDACRFGPSLTVAQQAGQALVRLREHDDPEPALTLPWHRPNLLRAHVVPTQLGELAAAAAAAGHGPVSDVLSVLPSPRRALQGATRLGHEPTSAWAEAHIAQLPMRPSYDLEVAVLGPVKAARGATSIVDEDWVRRERVRQLLALLLLHRRLSRRQAAELMWPELEPDRALQNLRVNLNHLQRALQPNRGRTDPPWFIQVDHDRLVVADEGLVIDAERFERRCIEARRRDEQAKGSRAIDAHREAAGLYTGDYLAEWPDLEWATVERVRLRSLAVSTTTRLGELLLATGEPEEATSWAAVALRHEPLLERGHRLLVRGLAGQGNQPAARAAAEDLLALLADEALVPERETQLLVAQLGVAGAA